MTETHGNATGGGGKGRTRSLEKLDGDPLGRLAKGVRDQETIVVCGPPMWERIELLEFWRNRSRRTAG